MPALKSNAAVAACLGFVAILAGMPARGLVPEADIAGASDHPLIDRYPGSVIDQYETTEFDEFHLALGPGKNRQIESTQTLEGRVTIIRYAIDKDRSTLEVFRNYEIFLKEKGFETLYACADKDCGGRDFNLAVIPYTTEQGDAVAGQRYLAAVLRRPEGDVHVSLYVTKASGLGGEKMDQVYARLAVIESKPMRVGLQHVSATEMAEKIAGEGRVALYGILFDYDSDVIKPESRPALDEIGKLLADDPELSLYVVGHTDNQGSYEYNKDLSQRRATAVVADLVKTYGVASSRLTPFGVSFLAPVATNRSEDGRARNRRVELVEQAE
jgi:outer membrane protein OmpA-like peptidoglycan-associated protein